VDRLCDLIDVAYDQIEHQLLNTTSTGNVYLKGTGETTGHSSTSADNSLALCILYLMAWKELTGLGAREFRHFNELSDYGDDHVLSMLSTKPAAWTFKNVQKVMARWGVENRLEAQGDLSKIPFLSKFSRKVGPDDRALFKRMNLPIPKRIVYHDRERLLGKMVAKIKNMDPKYRAKRLLSYLQLTAHHEDIYEGIKTVLTRSMTMKRAMKQMGLQVPTYQAILASWYHPTDHHVVDIIEEETRLIEKAGIAYSYGQVTLTDSIAGMLALLPDVLNPVLFNFGYERAFQIQAKRWLEWPRRLMLHQNFALTGGQMTAALKRTVYSCLDGTLFEDIEAQDPAGGLLPRHWLFLAWSAWLKPRWGRWLGGVTLAINKAQFVINARLNADIAEFRFGMLDMLVLSILNFVPEMPIFDILSRLRLPRIDYMIDMLWGFCVAWVWSSVPPNYKEVTHLVRTIEKTQGGLLVTAPTGTGKSTALIKHLSLITKGFYRKLVVVVPRSVLVKGLTPFVRDTLGVSATGFTQGLVPDKSADVWYMTPQEFMLHMDEALDDSNLVILDECHLEEPFYNLVKSALRHSKRPYLMTTATPTKANVEQCAAEVHLNTASLWDVQAHYKLIEEENVGLYLSKYSSTVKEIIDAAWRHSKCLVFYPNIEGGHRLGERLSVPVSYLNSKEQDTSGQVIICTNVADAGLTVPNVDVVITPVLDYALSPETGKPELHRLPEYVLKQRKGRTGRTNNGSFWVIDAPVNCQLMTGEILADARTNVPAWLALGLSSNTLQSLAPGTFRSFLNQFTGEDLTDTEFAHFAREIDTFLGNLKHLRQVRTLSRYQADVENPAVLFDYTAAGHVSESTFTPFEDITLTTIRLAEAAWRVSRGDDLDLGSVMAKLKEAASWSALEKPFHYLVPGLEEEDFEGQDWYDPGSYAHFGRKSSKAT
jgi:hypothetical protein